MSSYLPDGVNPSAFAFVKRTNKPQGTLLENFTKSFDAGLMQSGSSKERFIKEAWEPIVEEIKDITGKSFDNPGSYLRPNILEIGQGYPLINQKFFYDRYVKDVESYVRDNRDKLPDELVVSVLDPDRDNSWAEAAREKFKEETAELAEITERSPGVAPTVSRFLGGLAAGAEDPINQLSMAIPALRLKNTFSGIVIGEAFTNATVEAIQQPAVKEWYDSLGLDYDWKDFITNVGSAAVIGGAFPVVIKVGGETVKLTMKQAQKGVEVLTRASPKKTDIQEAAEILEEVATSSAESNPFVKTPLGQAEHQARLNKATVAISDGKMPNLSDATQSQIEVPDNLNEATNLQIFEEFDPFEIGVDAKTFQFKEGGDQFGVLSGDDSLQNVTEWNPMMAQTIMVYEYADGRLFIADGHQRLGLAKRIMTNDPSQKIRMLGYRIREVDGITPDDAVVAGALVNIAIKSSNVVDAAKILRIAPDKVGALPPRSTFVKQAKELSVLSNDAWGMVKNEIIAPNYAAIVGRLIPNNETMQKAALDVLVKTEPSNEFQAEAIVRQVRETDVVTETQENLFGEEVLTQSLFAERAKVLDRAQKQLRKDKNAFQNLIKNADRLEDEGNQLAKSANERRATNDGKAISLLQSQANRKGILSDALTGAARQAKETGNYNAATARFVEDVRRAISDGEFDRAEVSDAGRYFDTPEEIPTVRSNAETEELDAFGEMFGTGQAEQLSGLDNDVMGAINTKDNLKEKSKTPIAIPEQQIIRLNDLDFPEAKALEIQLKNEQAFVNVDEILSRANVNHGLLTQAIADASTKSGAKQKKAKVKTRKRIEEKLNDKYNGDLDSITDAARGGITADRPEIAEEFIEELSKRFKLVDEGYKFTNEGYFDRKLMVIFDDNQIGEVQIWAPGMLEAKEAKGTALYNISRSRKTKLEDRDKAVNDMLELYGQVKNKLSKSWVTILDNQTSDGISAPSLAVREDTISRVTSGERSSDSIRSADTGPQDPLKSPIIEPGDVSMAGIDPSIRKNRMDTSDESILLEELKVNFDDDFEVPTGRTVDDETDEVIAEAQSIRQLKDEFVQDQRMLDRLRDCAL